MVLKRAISQKNAISNTINRFDIGSSGQQVHISFGATDPEANRHPCFKLSSPEELEEIKASIYDHHVRGGAAAPMAADKPGDVNSGKRFLSYILRTAYDYLLITDIGAQGKEYPTRFFARDFAGNQLEFTI